MNFNYERGIRSMLHLTSISSSSWDVLRASQARVNNVLSLSSTFRQYLEQILILLCFRKALTFSKTLTLKLRVYPVVLSKIEIENAIWHHFGCIMCTLYSTT